MSRGSISRAVRISRLIPDPVGDRGEESPAPRAGRCAATWTRKTSRAAAASARRRLRDLRAIVVSVHKSAACAPSWLQTLGCDLLATSGGRGGASATLNHGGVVPSADGPVEPSYAPARSKAASTRRTPTVTAGAAAPRRACQRTIRHKNDRGGCAPRRWRRRCALPPTPTPPIRP